MSDTGYIVVITTCASDADAGRLTSDLMESRLAACVQSSLIRSVYRWQGKVEDAHEVRLMIKARHSDFCEIEKMIRRSHSYVNPEIIALPIVAGSPAYLDWIAAETRREIE